ncbi:MAG: Wzz/FepE/Etk N-terminal domain-containing protein [Clostridiales bacterium]|nr:Wzz/FepE/Etk N-terminal domain-containing protein [Clostridiales bacterium]
MEEKGFGINNNEDENLQQIDLFEILNVLLRHAWIIILSGVVCLAVVSLYTYFCVAPTYTSSLSFYVRNSEMQTSITSISTSEINSSIQLAKTYTVILQDDSILEIIGASLIDEFGVDEVSKYYTIVENEEGILTVNTNQLAGQIKIEPVDETEILEIKAVTQNPEFSAAICRSFEDIAPDELKRIVGIDYIESIGRAKVPTSPSGPNIKRNAVIGLIFGAFVNGVIIVLLNLLDAKIYNSDIIKEKYKVPVFGEVPYYDYG